MSVEAHGSRGKVQGKLDFTGTISVLPCTVNLSPWAAIHSSNTPLLQVEEGV